MMKKLIYTSLMILIYLFTMKTECYACDQSPEVILSLQRFGVYLNIGETDHFYSLSYDPDDGSYEDTHIGITAWSWRIEDETGYIVYYDDYGEGGDSFLDYQFTNAGKYKVRLWVKDNDNPNTWYGPAEKTVYVSKVDYPFLVYVDDILYAAYDSYSDPVYIPTDQPFDIYAYGTPFDGNLYFPAYPVSSPTWTVGGPSNPYYTLLTSEYCVQSGGRDVISFADGIAMPGLYPISAKAGANDTAKLINMIPVGVNLQTDINGDSVIDSTDDALENDPGGCIPIIGERKLLKLNFGPLENLSDGQVWIWINQAGASRADLYLSETGGTPDDSFYWDLSYPQAKETLQYYLSNGIYIQGTSPGDVEVYLEYYSPDDLYYNPLVSNTVNFTVVDVRLKEISFASTSLNMHTVYKDNVTGYYSAPHWKDDNLDGNPEREYPICFTKNTTMKASVKFYISSTSGINAKIKGDGPGNLDFPPTTATVGTNELSISDVTCSNSFANAVDFFDPMLINWQVSFDNGITWCDVRKSKNQTYITLAKPDFGGIPGLFLFHNLVHLSCKYADGQDNPDDCVSAIWDGIHEREVRLIDNTQLTYDPSSSNIITQQLLVNGTGNCNAWSKFFMDMLRVHDISSTKIKVTSTAIGGVSNPYLIVQDYTFTGSGKYSSQTPFVYKYGDDAVEETGIPGQGVSNPSTIFERHYIVKYTDEESNDHFYDPSYGGDSYDNQSAWENASLDGFAKWVDIWYIKMNDTNTTETDFVEKEENEDE